MYFVTRVFYNQEMQKSASIQDYDNEIAARKRFYSILASDIDSNTYLYELVQIVRDDGVCIASEVFDRREQEAE